MAGESANLCCLKVGATRFDYCKTAHVNQFKGTRIEGMAIHFADLFARSAVASPAKAHSRLNHTATFTIFLIGAGSG